MSDGIEALSKRLRNAQIELERATAALYSNLNSDNVNARYTRALLELDRAEDELENAQKRFKRKF